MRPFTDSYNSIAVINLGWNATWRRTRIHVGHVCFTSRHDALEVIRRRANACTHSTTRALTYISARTRARVHPLSEESVQRASPNMGQTHTPFIRTAPVAFALRTRKSQRATCDVIFYSFRGRTTCFFFVRAFLFAIQIACDSMK